LRNRLAVCVSQAILFNKTADVGITRDPYITFLETIPYRFYPIMMIGFLLFNIFLAMEFGPMLTSERVARGLSPLTGQKEDQQDQVEDLALDSYQTSHNKSETNTTYIFNILLTY
jgi:Na+/H+ antiporter NhaC